MNKRVQELSQLTRDSLPAQTMDVEQWIMAYNQKFAELLINESIEIMKQHDYHGEWLGEKIKGHFGVN